MQHSPDTINKVKLILDRVALGGTVTHACIELGISPTTFNKVVLGDSELNLAYTKARERRADFDADRIVEIADDNTIDPMQARNMINARQWRASKQYPSVYGDKIEFNLRGEISIVDTMAAARNRLIPRQSQDIIDVDALETPTLLDGKAKEDDIFT